MSPLAPITPQDPVSHSAELIPENIAALRALFPEAFTEGKVDFEVLKQLLGGLVDERDEKYGLNWNGKRRARQLALTPSMGTLRPCPEDSVDWDTTQNIFIEGDNLEVLKLLQKSYAGRVKMIYIDPPYNTGKDFVYPDNFQNNIQNYLELTGQVDGAGRKLSSNSETSGRYHTDWLNMMYPRLKLARNLLREDGVIFVSIADHEVDHLKSMMKEIFYEENFCAQFIWNTEGNTDNQEQVKVNHEYILAFYRNAEQCDNAIGHVIDPNTPPESNLWKGIADNNINKNNPANPPSIVTLPVGFPCTEQDLFYAKKELDEHFYEITKLEGMISDEVKEQYDIESKSGVPVKLDDLVVENHVLKFPCRIYGGMANRNKLEEFIKNNCLPIDDEGTPLRFYLNVNAGVRYTRENDKPRNVLSVLRGLGTTEKTKTYLKNKGISFDYPKPVQLLEYLVKIGCEGDGIILDFFAGSGTTAEAVANVNAAENSKKSFICVQIPEKTKATVRKKATEISRLTILRIKTILQEIKSTNPLFAGDTGFRVFKLDSSNIKTWDPDRSHLTQNLLDAADNLKEGRTEQDVLYEVLLKLGLDLCMPIQTKVIADCTVSCIGGGALFVCLAWGIDRDKALDLGLGLITWRKELDPKVQSSFVFRDSGFVNDVAKTNLVTTLEQTLENDVLSIRSI